MFIFAGLAIIAVFIALLAVPNDFKMPTAIWGYLLGGVLYIVGAIQYILRVPERCRPGKFDMCGSSH